MTPMIALQNHLTAPGWLTSNGVHVKGSAFLNGTLLNSKDLCAALQATSNENEFSSLLKSLNGYFAIIVEKNGEIFAATDIIRSIPLFYSIEDNILHISDDAESIQSRVNVSETSCRWPAPLSTP